MKKFAIVGFDNAQISIVPSCWLTEDKKLCAWPPRNFVSSCKACKLPEDDWTNYNIVKIYAYASKYLFCISINLLINILQYNLF